jgi:hypothetical protein
MVVEGLIWPFSPALGRAPRVCVALEWITIERLAPALVATGGKVTMIARVRIADAGRVAASRWP